MEKYLSIVNIRTFSALGFTALVTFLTINFNFQYNFDLTMISIAIIFPLVFTIRSAFKRREKALEFLSKFKAGLITTDAALQSNNKISLEDKNRIRNTIKEVSKSLKEYLGPEPVPIEKVRKEAQKITEFVRDHTQYFKFNPGMKIHGFMRDVYIGIENTASIKEHSTPASIRAYCLVFIYLYPVVYTPSLYYQMQGGFGESDSWVLYFLTLFSVFILISLYNVQEQLENPYDQKGLDDIQLNNFDLDFGPIEHQEKDNLPI